MSLEGYFTDFPDINIDAGQSLIHQGEHCENYFILKQGTVKVFARGANGKEVLLYDVTPGDICILSTSCMVGGNRFPAEAVAQNDLVLRLMNKAHFDKLMDDSRAFRQQVFASFSNRIGSLIDTVERLALESIDLRLAKFLLSRDEHAITQQEIARELGTAREVISRHLKRFASQGWIAIERGNIRVLDRDGLLDVS